MEREIMTVMQEEKIVGKTWLNQFIASLGIANGDLILQIAMTRLDLMDNGGSLICTCLYDMNYAYLFSFIRNQC